MNIEIIIESLLQEKFLKDNKDKKIVVLTVSNSGYALANKYFKLLRQIDDNHTIFVSKNKIVLKTD